MEALNFVLNFKNAKISKSTVHNPDDVWGIESHQQIKAEGFNGETVTVALDDHKYAGILTGSTVEIIVNGKKLSTADLEHQVICLKPSQKAEFEDAINEAIE